jgi:hypothetical protein
MDSSVQYSALNRLLTHNNRVHDLGEILNRMPVGTGDGEADEVGSIGTEINAEFNPF